MNQPIRKRPLALRKEPKQDRAAFTVDAILEATSLLLKQHGFDRLNVNDVAERAGFSVGSLYQYFSSKEALLAELRRRHHRSVAEALRRALRAAPDEPFESGLRTVIRANVRVHALDPELHHLLNQRYGDVGFEIDADQPSTALAAAVAKELAAGFAEYFDVSRSRAIEMLRVLATIVESITHAAVLDGTLSLDEDALVEEIAAAALGYLDRAASPSIGSSQASTAGISRDRARQ